MGYNYNLTNRIKRFYQTLKMGYNYNKAIFSK